MFLGFVGSVGAGAALVFGILLGRDIKSETLIPMICTYKTQTLDSLSSLHAWP